MSCGTTQYGGSRKRKYGGAGDEMQEGGLFANLGGGAAGEYPGAYGAAAQAGGSVVPITQGGGRRYRRMSRRKGRAGKSRTRSTCSGGSKKRKSRKSGGSKKRSGKSRKH